MIGLLKANEIRKKLSDGMVAVTSSIETVMELEKVHGIKARLLFCVEGDNILIMEQGKYEELKAQEEAIIEDADKRNSDQP